MAKRIQLVLPILFGVFMAVSFVGLLADLAGKVRYSLMVRTHTQSPQTVVGVMTAPHDDLKSSNSTAAVGRYEKAYRKIKSHLDSSVRFPAKKSFAAIDVKCTWWLTGTLRSAQVLQGNNGWLFYSSKTDADSMGDYIGESRMSPEEMERACRDLNTLGAELQLRGIEFCLVVAPNKENVYVEYMPCNVRRISNVSRTDVLMDYLAANATVPIVYPKKDLLEKKSRYEVYYPLDTHWNPIGAYIGVQSVLRGIGRKDVPVEWRKIVRQAPTMEYEEYDLIRVSHASAFYTSPPEASLSGLPSLGEFVDEQGQRDDLRKGINNQARGKGTLLLIGDSFRRAMVSPFMEEFPVVYDIGREQCRDLRKTIAETKPTVVVLEFVERYSADIAKWIEGVLK